jgi:hypothetical protein
VDTLVQGAGSTHVCPVIHPSIHSFIHSFWRFHVGIFHKILPFPSSQNFLFFGILFLFLKISKFCQIIYLNSAKVLW